MFDMTRKRFFNLRRALITKVIQTAKEEGYYNGINDTNRMDRPLFGSIIQSGKYKGKKLTSYEQAEKKRRKMFDIEQRYKK